MRFSRGALATEGSCRTVGVSIRRVGAWTSHTGYLPSVSATCPSKKQNLLPTL
jgi:hypothetical protein